MQNKELLTTTGTEKAFPLNKLINKLNHLNFTDGAISIIFRHKQNQQDILIKAYPQPCMKNQLTCRLALDDTVPDLSDYLPHFLMIDDGLSTMVAPVQLLSLHEQMLTVKLPEEGLIKTNRATKRHYCRDIICEIIQDDIKQGGTLVDFTPNAFCIRLTEREDGKAFAHPETAIITLLQNNTKCFSGSCRLVRNSMSMPNDIVVYAPADEEKQLFPKRKIRNPREHNAASFSVKFHHPFYQEHIERDIFDVSTSGFSIKVNSDEQTLMTGMIIPELTIIYAGVAEMKCSAQVVYRSENRESHVVQNGLAITDMDIRSYSRLNHLVGTHLDANAHISTTVDMETLWEFFFDTGFIYGEKYQHLYPHRNAFKETYRKLYQDNPDIARHFTYEKNGKLYGHIAMVHAYEPAWVIHHYSAKPLESRVPGFLILRQIIHFLNGCYRFRSFGIEYVMTYYRPDNRVVDKVFGGFARELNNPKGSSLDLFSYLHFDKSSSHRILPAGFMLRQCLPGDFEILKAFYEKSSGGLLFDSFRLDLPMEPLEDTFHHAGFKRSCQTYCLCHNDRHLAFFIVNQSDIGLNLSDLLNSITILIMDEKELKWDTLSSAIKMLDHFYETEHIPLLVYPAHYLNGQGIDIDKHYQLWIVKNDPYSEQYTDYMVRKFRMKYSSVTKI
ncbi:MAG: hypothetical protein Q8O28_01110 [Smithellaceae bacterium]|nr:hypothetical protein [Smithellaceae bacterium]